MQFHLYLLYLGEKMSTGTTSPLVVDRGREFLWQFITRLLGEHSIGEKVVSGSHEPASDRIK